MPLSVIITHSVPVVSFYTPWKHQKTSGIEIDLWHEMGKLGQTLTPLTQTLTAPVSFNLKQSMTSFLSK